MQTLQLLNTKRMTTRSNIEEITFLPRHKYSFTYNDKHYIGFFKKCLEREDMILYIFNNFTIESNINEQCYIFDFQYHKLSPSISRLLEQHERFSDSDTDGFESDISPNYKMIMNNQIKDDMDDYVKVEKFP